MQNIPFLIIILLLSVTSSAQHSNNNILTDNQELFPERCLGVWEGTMYMYSYKQLQDSVNVRFTAAKTDAEGTYTWKTEYLSKTRPVTKDYKLVVDDVEKGRYILDEGDGTELIEYNVGNKLYSLFQVGDIYLTSTTELIGDMLVHEVTSGKEVNEDKGVINYSYSNVQRVELMRVHDE